ncbi:MAG: peptidoglycan-binding protein [Syntrophomonas sp.]
MILRIVKRSRFTLLAAILCLAMLIPGPAASAASLSTGSRGEEVRSLQADLTVLGYNTQGVDGIFGQNTYDAVLAYQQAHRLPADGIAGDNTRAALNREIADAVYTLQWRDSLEAVASKYGTTVQAIRELNGITSWVLPPGLRLLIPGRTVPAAPSRGGSHYGEIADWWTVANKVFAIGKVATITDLDTGLQYQVVRKAGSNHADCQPLTAADTANMLKAYGGEWSWTRHAILVAVDGRLLAASQNAMPHGGQSIWNNNFPGHFCIHFLNSRTHGTNRVDPAHQAAVRKAAGQ